MSDVSVEEEIAKIFIRRPHMLLLGAGASKAALPAGDRQGRPVPILRELAEELDLHRLFPEDLQDLSNTDFEAAYSHLFNRGESQELEEISQRIRGFFSELELPVEANLYDIMQLCLRKKDVIATFNWDPFVVQSRSRLLRLGVSDLPNLLFLHGNVAMGYCPEDKCMGAQGLRCDQCGKEFHPTKLLYPVENKNYQDGEFIEKQWKGVRYFLNRCLLLSVFGYSAPKTDVEAISLLQEGWGNVKEREFEQTEVISRPGSDHERLRTTWDPFIHTHHYEIFDSFYESFLANHPRRSGEAFWNKYIAAQFIEDNPVPSNLTDLEELVAWFQPLFEAEAAGYSDIPV